MKVSWWNTTIIQKFQRITFQNIFIQLFQTDEFIFHSVLFAHSIFQLQFPQHWSIEAFSDLIFLQKRENDLFRMIYEDFGLECAQFLRKYDGFFTREIEKKNWCDWNVRDFLWVEIRSELTMNFYEVFKWR